MSDRDKPTMTSIPCVAARGDRVPSFEEWARAIGSSLYARVMCWEAIGYARGWCDHAEIGSSEAVDFGKAYGVLVAAGGSRPAICRAWDNWRHGRAIDAFD
ncbi:hypothetical protein AB0H76_09915 [Nocardia sp. NPDC050712]|uniref:hypothetical protein n=1 Tax=Nocardia sp. NPDC050712 TaxID=3155518 RepID=UPI003408FFF8